MGGQMNNFEPIVICHPKFRAVYRRTQITDLYSYLEAKDIEEATKLAEKECEEWRVAEKAKKTNGVKVIWEIKEVVDREVKP